MKNNITENDKAGIRIFKKDGSSNTKRIGINKFASYNIYHTLVGLNWTLFTVCIVSFYVIINSLFASIFYYLPKSEFGGNIHEMNFNYWWKMFFFSTQTITTVGYGQMPPIGFYANLICSIEALIGLLFFALITGLLYGRFSKPTAKLFFSENVLVSLSGKSCIYNIRVANAKISQLIDANAQMIVCLDEIVNSIKERKLYYVSLINDNIAFLNSSWTISHISDRNSPLYNLNLNDLKNKNVEFILLIKATDDTYATQVNARISYQFEDVIWNANFDSMSDSDNQMIITDLRKLNSFSNVD